MLISESLLGDLLYFIVVEFYTEWLITELNSLQDIVERLNREIYFLADCFIRVTALLEYLNLALATPSWIPCYNSVALNMIVTQLKVLSKMIIPFLHQFSNGSPEQFF